MLWGRDCRGNVSADAIFEYERVDFIAKILDFSRCSVVIFSYTDYHSNDHLPMVLRNITPMGFGDFLPKTW